MKNNKNKKKKLSSLILLLLLTVIMLGSATYAWFTANKTVTIEKIDVNVATSSGLQISTDAINWKTKISNADIKKGYTGSINQLTSEMKPVSSVGDVDTANGHMNMFSGAVTTNDAGEFVLNSVKLTDAESTESNPGTYIAFDIFLKTEDEGKDIYLTSDSNVIPKVNEDGTNGTDTGLKNSARVAFVVEGNAVSTSTAATLQALHAATKNSVIFWEPNADSHTDNGVAAAAQYYGVNTGLSVGTGNAAVSYAGIKAAFSSGILLSETNPKKSADYFENVATGTIKKLLSTAYGQNSYSDLTTLSKGVTKIRVYMWVEGNDVDCENNASGSNITYNVILSQNSGV